MENNIEFQVITEKINNIFRDVLENEEINIKYETTANDVDEWDSLSHILLVVAIEKNFQIEFTTKEIQDFKNVGEMCEGIMLKLKISK
tara:strand:- start:2085 stop:2348 length:264 start_codon:yes stop_codon:yes gene_type:complete